jgi:hypothetical protein
MSIGGTKNAVNGINLTDAELAQIYTTPNGTITFGDNSQTGNITFTNAGAITTPGGSALVVQSATGTTTTTILTASQTSVMYGTQVIFTATVAAQSGNAAPIGSVEFFDGTTDLGSGTAGSSNGTSETWTFTTANTTAGRLQAGTGQIITLFIRPRGFSTSAAAASLVEKRSLPRRSRSPV